MSSHLPHTRIKTIMKSSADVESISKESLQLVGIATELFIQYLAQAAEKETAGKEIQYRHIADVVNTSDRYEFLREIIPRKILVRDFKKMLKRNSNANAFNSQSSSADSDSDSSTSTTTTSSSLDQ